MNNEKAPVKMIVDLSTGEYDNIYEGDKLKVIKEDQLISINKSIKKKEANEDIKNWSKELGGFIFFLFKYNSSITLSEHKDILQEDITKLFYLATYVDYDGYLINNDAYMKRSDIQNILKVGRNSFDSFYNKMKRIGVFTQDKNKNTKINKQYFVKGSFDKEIKQYIGYTKIYVNTIRYLFENVSHKKYKQLGNYFKIIPYIHRQNNVLCWNPNEIVDSPKDINLMNVRELKKILGYSKNGLKGFMNEMFAVELNNGQPIMAFLLTGWSEDKSFIIINPNVFYGGNFMMGEVNIRNDMMKWFN